MNLAPFERCDCATPCPTGRSYLSWEACLCGYLMPRTRRERRDLEDKELHVLRSQRERDVLTHEQVMRIVTNELLKDPMISNSRLRFKVSDRGNFPRSDTVFGRLVQETRDLLRLPKRSPIADNGRVP